MNKVILSIVVIAALGFTSCKNQTEKVSETESKNEVVREIAMTEMTFGVRGNCGMCKETIEKAANGVEGVSNANWEKNKKKIDVSFDGTKTDVMTIHNAIANSGYDTEKVAGNLDAYENLPGCCQYDHEMVMNQTGEEKIDDDSEHEH